MSPAHHSRLIYIYILVHVVEMSQSLFFTATRFVSQRLRGGDGWGLKKGPAWVIGTELEE